MFNAIYRKELKNLFSEDQWDLIYAMAGHALDDDKFNPEDVYHIRNTIHSIFDEEWHPQLSHLPVMLSPTLVLLVWFQRSLLLLLLSVVIILLLFANELK